MTPQEFRNYVNSLPPDLRAMVLERARQTADHVERATAVRDRIRRDFPNLNPRVVAALSLVIARFT